MRQKSDPTLVVGMCTAAREVGADEDDFHTFRRTTVELDRADKREEKVKRMLGVVSGIAVRKGTVPLSGAKKKVVVFK
jgi:zinc finger CCHC domain-containing protein 9